MRQQPIGSAGEEVLTWLASRRSRTWGENSRDAWQGSRAMTDAVCKRLAANGYLDVDYRTNRTTYTLNRKGLAKARDLRYWF